jgi:hypothetical protein
MGVLNGTPVRVVKNLRHRVKYVNPYREYNLVNQKKLSTVNVDNGENDKQIKAVMNHYKIKFGTLLEQRGDKS